jgi:hypothetical protein
VDGADIPRLRGWHGINQCFEALTKQEEKSRTMVHTRVSNPNYTDQPICVWQPSTSGPIPFT